MSEHQVAGLHAVQALISRRSAHVERIWVDAGRKDPRVRDLVALARQKNVAVEFVAREALDRASDANHQGVLALLKPDRISNETALEDLLEGLPHPPFLLVLDSVTDPHNLGACLRSANAAGVDAVIVPKDRSAPLNEGARKVACGAAEMTPLIRVTNLARTLEHLKACGIWIVGTAGEAELGLFDAALQGPLALVMGAEDKGLRRLTREHCDALIHIPMAGGVSSLNVSVATGICLFEAVRQRRT